MSHVQKRLGHSYLVRGTFGTWNMAQGCGMSLCLEPGMWGVSLFSLPLQFMVHFDAPIGVPSGMPATYNKLSSELENIYAKGKILKKEK